MHAGNCAQIPSFPRKREPRDAGCCRRLWTPAFAQGCPGKVEEPFVRAFCSEFYLQEPLARARPGHPRLDATAISVKKTWVPTDQSPWAEGPRIKVRGLKAHGPCVDGPRLARSFP